MNRSILSPEEIEALLGADDHGSESEFGDVEPDTIAELFRLAFDVARAHDEEDDAEPLAPFQARSVPGEDLAQALDGTDVQGVLWQMMGACSGEIMVFIVDGKRQPALAALEWIKKKHESIARALSSVFQSEVELGVGSPLKSGQDVIEYVEDERYVTWLGFSSDGPEDGFYLIMRAQTSAAMLELLASEAGSAGAAASEDYREPHGGSADRQSSPGSERGLRLGSAFEIGGVRVEAVGFQDLLGEESEGEERNLGFVSGVGVDITVELGRTEMKIDDIMALKAGKVVELNRLAGESVDVMVNERLVAKGEVVVIDDYFGVKINEIIAPHHRTEGVL